MPSELLVAVPSAAAVIFTVKLFLQHMASERDKDRTLWENHLSSSVRILQEMKDTLKELRDDVRFR